jgi:isopenicillin N synthase-like dioxygenase
LNGITNVLLDISPYLKDPKSPESKSILTDVKKACESTGFFQILNHGVPATLQDRLFSAAEKFFKLPFDDKKALDAKNNVGHRGYDVLASQSYEAGVLPDLKEVSDDLLCCFACSNTVGILRGT